MFGDGLFRRVIGLEVTGRHGRRWFLPSVAASHAGVVLLDSTPVLVETGDLEGCGRLGAVLVRDAEALAGLVVDGGGRVVRDDLQSVSLPAAAGTSVG